MGKKRKGNKGPGTPWRDNIEALTVAIVVAIVLKHFLVEAYKIPTGSMQPTLLGLDVRHVPREPRNRVERALLWFEENVVERVRGPRSLDGFHDRILVDKVSYLFRDPRRWEVIVFRYPLDRSKNFVKRVVGMPGEDIRIAHGDLWTRPNENHAWEILRRPRSVQRATWRSLDRDEPEESSWQVVDGGLDWSFDGRAIEAPGDGRARFSGGSPSILDSFQDGYPDALRDRVWKSVDTQAVGDLRLEFEVTASATCRTVEVELREMNRNYRFLLPGPAADADAAPTVVIEDPSTNLPAEQRFARGDGWRLPADQPVRIGAQNLDDLLELDVDGEVVCALEVQQAVNPVGSSILLSVHGGGASFAELMPYRDIYYTVEGNTKTPQTSIPEDQYFVLGDNTQDSADSREWQYFVYDIEDEDGEVVETVRGNKRGGTYAEGRNPWTDVGHPEGPIVWIRDEWGERRHFESWRVGNKGLELAPFVPREMVLGRAVSVFWPILPHKGVVRLHWIH